MKSGLFSWKRPSKGTDASSFRVKKLKSKSEKFSFATNWEECDDENDLKKTLQSGLKILIRRHNSDNNLGFNNCILWLAKESPSLEVWTPSTGEHQVINLTDIQAITVMREENILIIKCSNDEYQLKITNTLILERLRLILKMATAKTTVPTRPSDLIQTPEKINFPSTLSSQSEKSNTDENIDPHKDSSSSRLRLNSGQQLSLRSPNLNSPSCLEDRVGARSRLRGRASFTMQQIQMPQSENLSTAFKEPTADRNEKSPKRSRDESEIDSRHISPALSSSPLPKKIKSKDCDIINNDTIRL
jgi:hypothetical protein